VVGSGWAGLAAAATLGAAASFWTTATQDSISPMTALFAVLMLAAALDYRRAAHEGEDPAAGRALLRFGLAAGFGVTHHASLLFPGSVLALAIIAARPALIREVRRWGPALLAALAGAIPWLYLLARGAAGALLAPPDLATWDGFWRHVLAAGFAGDMFYYRTLPEVLERLRLIAQVVAFQWQSLTLLLAGLALILMLRRDRWLALTLGSAFAVHSLVSASYRAPQTVEYMIPAYVCLAAGIGWLAGAGGSDSHRGRRAAALLAALSILGAIQSGWPTWVSLRLARERDHTADDAHAVLTAAPQDSVILANWHHATPLWYVQAEEAARPDVEIRYVAPAGAEPILDTWLRLIAEESVQRPVVTCSYYPETFRRAGLPFSALESCWRAGQPETQPVLAPLTRFEDYALLSARMPAGVSAGDHLVVDLDWLLPEAVPYGELTSFTHLIDSAGALLAQDDRPFLADGADGPLTVTQRHMLFLPRTIPPGEYRLLAGLYRPSADGPLTLADDKGQPRVEIGRIAVGLSTVPPVTARPVYFPFGAVLRLTGYDYDLSVPGRARLYLHWAVAGADPADIWTIAILGSNGELARQTMILTGSGFLTTAHDVPDTEAVSGLRLKLSRDGAALAVRGAFGLPLAGALRLEGPRPGERYVPIGDMVLAGVELLPASQPGESTSVDLTMRSLVPLDRDMTLKLAYGTLAGIDTPPAGGTIPTLKWGWQATVTSWLSLPWPADHPAPPGPLTLTIYDAFTSEAWPILDPVLGQHGPALILLE